MKNVGLLIVVLFSQTAFAQEANSLLVSNCTSVDAVASGVSKDIFKGFRIEVKKEENDFYLYGFAEDFRSEANVSLTMRSRNITLLGLGDDDEMYWNRRTENPGDAFPGAYKMNRKTGSVEVYFFPYGSYDSDEMPKTRAEMLALLSGKNPEDKRNAKFLVKLSGCKINHKLMQRIRGSKYDR